MAKIGLIDLEFLHLALKNGGMFNETDIEKSELKRLGVGRTLDALASLKDREFLEMNENSFQITNKARQILWNSEIPLSVKILRILDIKSLPSLEISKFLDISEEKIFEELEILRKKELVLMSPQRIQEKLEKIYEVLPLGKEQLEKIEEQGFENADLVFDTQTPKIEVYQIINELKKDAQNIQDEKQKKIILEKIELLKNKLEI